MFSNLIESGSHAADLRRKGRFFLGTVVFYGLLLVATGVGSIYAYNARLDEPNELEVIALMHFPPAEVRTETVRHNEPRPAGQSRVNQLATRPELSYVTPYHDDRIASSSTKEISPNTPVVIAPFTSDPVSPGGPAGTDVLGIGHNPGGEVGPAVSETEAPPPPRVTTTPAPAPQKPSGPITLPSYVLSGKAISKPAPPYPIIAKQAHIQGPVAVQIVIDEQGRVISARATSGNPLLQQAAVQAAYQARFTPTLLSGQPLKVTGSITYNFVLN